MGRRASVVALVLAALVPFLGACEGPTGPEGPQGPAGAQGPTGPMGPEGPPGPGTRVVYSGTLDGSGFGSVNLPAAAGTVADPPAIACYISDDGQTWLVVATDTNGSSGMSCGLGRASSSTLYVGIVGAPAFWMFRIVVVY